MQTGLDLVDFPTIVWFETDYSVYTMRQASRRSWRIGQSRPVKVVLLAYRNSLQAEALKLVARELQSSLAVEGELPEDGLAAFGDDGDDLMLALARKIVCGEENAEPVEAVFAQARDAAASAEEYLVDGWQAVEVEPEVDEVNSSRTNGNVVCVAVAIATTVKLVLENGRHEEVSETQRSLFSWAEFMVEEPVTPKSRGRRPQPATASLFEWTLNLERDREDGLVGAGC